MKKVQSLLLFAFVLMFSAACTNKAAENELKELQSKQQIEEQNKSIVQRYWVGKWNERRPEILDELQTSDVVYHGTSMSMNGLDEYKQVYSGYLAALQNSHVDIEGLMADGDLVMSRCKITAVHGGELDGLPPTGKTIETSMFTVFRLIDGKIAEEWEIMDELGFMSQLGMELQPKELVKD